jgi:biotin carboxyl carrier protein
MRTYKLTISGRTYEVEVQSIEAGLASVLVNGKPYTVELDSVPGLVGSGIQGPQSHAGSAETSNPAPPSASPAAGSAVPQSTSAARPSPARRSPGAASSSAASAQAGAQAFGAAENVIVAPMPGLIIEIMVEVGDRVKAGETVVRIEAMKMENDIVSPADGVVTEVRTTKGKEVRENEVLMVLST